MTLLVSSLGLTYDSVAPSFSLSLFGLIYKWLSQSLLPSQSTSQSNPTFKTNFPSPVWRCHTHENSKVSSTSTQRYYVRELSPFETSVSVVAEDFTDYLFQPNTNYRTWFKDPLQMSQRRVKGRLTVPCTKTWMILVLIHNFDRLIVP